MLPQPSIMLFGTKITLHWSWWIFAMIIIFPSLVSLSAPAIAYHLWIIAWMLVIITGHEMAHALAGKSYGILTRNIYIHFLGGVAVMDRPISANNHKQSVWISFAGPLFNFVFALICLLPLPLAIIWLPQAAMNYFLFPILANVIIGVFNLIPAYPLDGGRIARSALQLAGVKESKAVKITQVLSLIFGSAMAVAGLYFFDFSLALIGALVIAAVIFEKKTGRQI